ncbi:MAG: hypothetical protein ACLPX8_03410 [Bryobacteraceae bacterium]|jgi:hypothetical protein
MLEHTRKKTNIPEPPPDPPAAAGPPAAFQWLTSRIGEERERRRRETEIQDRLPEALHELHEVLSRCVDTYRDAFGRDAAEISFLASRIRVTVAEGKPNKAGATPALQVEVVIDVKVPGFTVRHGSDSLEIRVDIFSGGKPSYRDGDQYLNMEDLTRRILDPVFFPKLGE